MLPLAVVFLLSFMVLDTMLSLAFLCWPLVSPNDFHLVDHRVWRLNWSPLAKAANTAGVVVAIAARRLRRRTGCSPSPSSASRSGPPPACCALLERDGR